jgi:chromosome segregation ATPase
MNDGIPMQVILDELGRQMGKLEVQRTLMVLENEQYKKEIGRLQEENAELQARLARLEQAEVDRLEEAEAEHPVAPVFNSSVAVEAVPGD